MDRPLKQAKMEELRNLTKEKKANFAEAVESAKFAAPAGSLPDNIKQHIEYVTAQYDDLLSLFKDTMSAADGTFIEDRVKELEKHRIYVLPIPDLRVEAAEYLAELSSWGVPEESLSLIKKWVDKLEDEKTADAEKRSIMLQIIEDYEFWDGYVTWVIRATNIMRGVAFFLIVVGLLLSFHALSRNNPTLAFILAGVSGSAISVLLKIPAVLVYKDFWTLIAKFTSRIGTGIVVSVVGLGLLSSKMINLAFDVGTNKLTLADLICCPQNLTCPEVGQSILIGIGVLFGFSERLLTSLEDTLVGKLNLPGRDDKKSSQKSEP